jgi:hypothetical protein
MHLVPLFRLLSELDTLAFSPPFHSGFYPADAHVLVFGINSL